MLLFVIDHFAAAEFGGLACVQQFVVQNPMLMHATSENNGDTGWDWAQWGLHETSDLACAGSVGHSACGCTGAI